VFNNIGPIRLLYPPGKDGPICPVEAPPPPLPRFHVVVVVVVVVVVSKARQGKARQGKARQGTLQSIPSRPSQRLVGCSFLLSFFFLTSLHSCCFLFCNGFVSRKEGVFGIFGNYDCYLFVVLWRFQGPRKTRHHYFRSNKVSYDCLLMTVFASCRSLLALSLCSYPNDGPQTRGTGTGTRQVLPGILGTSKQIDTTPLVTPNINNVKNIFDIAYTVHI
jgi:hypothetical protein